MRVTWMGESERVSTPRGLRINPAVNASSLCRRSPILRVMHRRLAAADLCLGRCDSLLVDISGIHFHDTQILRVVENTAADTLTMHVEYPADWEHSISERRTLIFSDAHNYQVFEFPFSGPPTILAAEVIGTSDR